LACKEQL